MANNFEKRREQKVNSEKRKLFDQGYKEKILTYDSKEMFIFSLVLSLAIILPSLYIPKLDGDDLLEYFGHINNIVISILVLVLLILIKELIRGCIIFHSSGEIDSLEPLIRRNRELSIYSTKPLEKKSFILSYTLPFILVAILPIIVGLVLNNVSIILIGAIMTLLLSKDVYKAFKLSRLDEKKRSLYLEDIDGKKIFVYSK